MRPLIVHCRLGLARLARHAGRRETARDHLATTTTMCDEMGMQFWLEKAKAETVPR